MPLSPTPLPGTSPLPLPGQCPPDRRALRLGVLSALPVLLVVLVLGQMILPKVVYLVPGLEAQAGSGRMGQSQGGELFQGFNYLYARREGGAGFSGTGSAQNLKSQASLFHMNSVIIPVIADMPVRSGSDLSWHPQDGDNKDTLPDADYEKAIHDAKAAGLVPILELQVRQQDTVLNPGDESSTRVGQAWFNNNSSIQTEDGNGSASVVQLEQGWFNNYTAFATHFAQMSAKDGLPYFIIGDQLSNVTWDADNTLRKADPQAIDIPPGDPETNCTGRRDCEWRHLINAVRSATYAQLGNHSKQQGGGYKGKLVYAANWTGAEEGAVQPEFEHISWWNAVDFVGVDAFFPLTAGQADVGVNDLVNAWHGQGANLASSNPALKDIFSRLEHVADTANRQLVFTAAGYESIVGSNAAPSHSTCGCADDAGKVDDQEQLNDMQALMQTFSGAPWWAGVFWYADSPVSPRTSQPGWATNTNWAGDTLSNSKLAGQWLAHYYHTDPIRP